MKIVIISNFSRNFSQKDKDRFAFLGNLLSGQNQVEIVTSDFYHTQKVHRNKVTDMLPYKVTFLHEPGYKKNICLKRFWSHFVWGKNVGKYLKSIDKPDVVYCAVPSLTAAKEAARFCKKRGIKFAIDVQDLWPEAFKMVLNIPLISEILFFPFQKCANSIYKNADEVFAVSKTYVERVLSVNQKGASGHMIYLGIELSEFDCAVKENLPIITKEAGELWIAYCGTLGSSYDMKCALDALNLANQKSKQPIKMIIMGNGPLMESFEKYAKEIQANALFLGRLPYGQMCALLAQSDMTINPIVKGSAASIINKHGDYAASGLPVINTQESPEYRALIEQYQMGYNCTTGDSADVAAKLLELAGNKEKRMQMGKNARRCAEECFDRANTYHNIVELLSNIEQ